MVYDHYFRTNGFNVPNEVECPEPVEGLHFVYLLFCNDESLYCGCTSDLKKRMGEHRSGEAALWTKMRRPLKLVYFEAHESLLAARRRERQIKGWTVKKKTNLITGVWQKA
jgi:putative endonuclease